MNNVLGSRTQTTQFESLQNSGFQGALPRSWSAIPVATGAGMELLARSGMLIKAHDLLDAKRRAADLDQEAARWAPEAVKPAMTRQRLALEAGEVVEVVTAEELREKYSLQRRAIKVRKQALFQEFLPAVLEIINAFVDAADEWLHDIAEVDAYTCRMLGIPPELSIRGAAILKYREHLVQVRQGMSATHYASPEGIIDALHLDISEIEEEVARLTSARENDANKKGS